MSEKMRVSICSYVPGLPDQVDLMSIRHDLNDEISKLEPQINVQDLADWRLIMVVLYRQTDGIGVFKRARRYPSDKEFEISISIPVPDAKDASYGFTLNDFMLFFSLHDQFHVLKPNFENYKNLHDYFLESTKQAIHLAFTKGIVCGGKRIKFQN